MCGIGALLDPAGSAPAHPHGRSCARPCRRPVRVSLPVTRGGGGRRATWTRRLTMRALTSRPGPGSGGSRRREETTVTDTGQAPTHAPGQAPRHAPPRPDDTDTTTAWTAWVCHGTVGAHRAPVAASRITTVHDWVDESTPATSGTVSLGRRTGVPGRAGRVALRGRSPATSRRPGRHGRRRCRAPGAALARRGAVAPPAP